MYFDTHAHYDDEKFDEDRDELLSSMPENDVTLIVNPGSDLPSSKMAVELTKRYPFVYSAVGVHPHEASTVNDEVLNELRLLTKNPKVVAIGEIGLDYYYDFSPRDIQREAFYKQLELARELNLPVVIHERDACEDCLNIITQFKDLKGVFHCFSGSWETAKIILDQGWYLSFTGAVTFKNARKAPEVIEKMPIDRLFIETDSPYLAPVPHRGKRNSSLFLPHIAQRIGELKGLTAEEVAAVTMENGKKFFGIS